MEKLKKLFKIQKGFAMPMALFLVFIAGMIVAPVVALVYTNLKANIVVQEKTTGTYAADSGIQYALWKFTDGVKDGTYAAGSPIVFPGDDGNGNLFYSDQAGYQVTVSVVPVSSEYGYADFKIISVARDVQTNKGSEIIAYVRSAVEPIEGASPFNYALATLGGDLIMTGSSQISCIPNPPAVSCDDGDVWVNGDIYMGWSNVINGTATLTGTVYSPNPNPDIDVIMEGADPILRPTWLDDRTNEYIASTTIALPSFGGTCGTWTDAAATYNNPICIDGNMTLGRSGTYRFKDTVWVKGNLVIQSGENHVFFEKSVKVDGNITLQGNGTVTFQNTTSSSEDTIALATYPVTADFGIIGNQVNVQGYVTNAVLHVPNGLGRNVSITAKLQERNGEAEAWADVDGGAFIVATRSNTPANFILNYNGDKKYLRAVATVAGGDCQFGVTINKITLLDNILYVGGYLYGAGSRSARFESKVAVNGASTYSNYAIYFDGSKFWASAFDIEFWRTLRANGNMKFGSGRSYSFYDVIYATGNIIMDGSSGTLNISKASVADGAIRISAGAAWAATSYMTAPFIISRKIGCCTLIESCDSTCDGVCLTGNVNVTAIIYAPDSRAYVDGSSTFNGAIVSKCAMLRGNVRLNYPVVLDDREDLENPNAGTGSDFSLVSYSIQQ